MRTERIGVLFVVPTLFLLFFVMFYPLAYSLWISLHRWNLQSPSTIGQFIGLGNWIEVVSSPYFSIAFFNSLYFALFTVSSSILISLCFAIVLNEEFRGNRIIKSLILIPWAIPAIANAAMWKWIYDSNYGFLNMVLYNLGLINEYLSFLSTPSLAQFAVINAQVYRMVPLGTIVILAALQTVPKELLEAAEIDGASAIKKFFSITWPWIKPSFLIILILNTLDAFRVFDIIYLLTQGGPAYATTILAYFIYQESFVNLDFGHGATVGYILAIITGIIAIIYTKLTKGV